MTIQLQSQSNIRIVSAPWVIVDAQCIVENGAVALSEDRICAVGPHAEIVNGYPGVPKDNYPGVLMPPLVNAHMHLELSIFPGEKPLGEAETFTDWVEALLEKRFSSSYSEQDLYAAVEEELRCQHDLGVALIGDIGNQNIKMSPGTLQANSPQVYRMIELLGASGAAVAVSLEQLESIDASQPISAHAPYSTRPELLCKIKKRCKEQGHIFSIHTAEVREERRFIVKESGLFRDFLEKRGAWDSTFFKHGTESKSTIDYFHKLELLDDHTLLVHCVHVSDNDMKIIKETGAHICVCAGSNAYLHSGVAPVERMIQHGLIPALGTDSASSNQLLSIWDEMQRISTEHPDIEAKDIVAMATDGGAKALHCEHDYGSLHTGKKATFLHVFSDKIKQSQTVHDLLYELVSCGTPDTIEWI